MRLHETNNYMKSNMGGSDSNFTIKASHKAFKILSDNLYKDKITAVIRELSANAIDAHIDAGNPDPFEVHLPTALEPEFKVIDRGVGMTHTEIIELYTTYFSSSKTERDDQIGALGLGSKSPFAYTDSFNIISVKDGIKGIYTCYIGEGGTPAVKTVHEEESNDHNGTEINFPVKEKDFDTFIGKAAKLYWAFNTKPKITGASNQYAEVYKSMFDEVVVLQEHDNWKLYKKLPDHLSKTYNQQAQVRMGNIIYPIDKDQLEDLSDKAKAVVKNPFIIEMPLGACDIAPSREELNYDTETITNLFIELEAAFDKYLQYVTDGVDTCTTAWDAMIYVNERLGYIRNSVPEFTFKFKGKEYKFGEQLEVTFDKKIATVVYVDTTRTGRETLIDRTNKHVEKIQITPSKQTVFISCEWMKYVESYHYRARVRHLIQSTDYKTAVMLVNPTAVDISLLGNPPVMNYDDVPKVPRQPRSGSTPTSQVTAYLYQDRSKEWTFDQLKKFRPTQKKALVVLKNRAYHKVVNGGLSKMPRESFESMLSSFSNVDILPWERLVVVPYLMWKHNKEFFNGDTWVTPQAIAELKLRRKYAEIAKDYIAAKQHATVRERYGYLIDNHTAFQQAQFHAKSVFGKFMKEAVALNATSNSTRDLDNRMYKLNRAMGHIPSQKLRSYADKIKDSARSEDDHFDLFKQYPLLTLLKESWELRRTDGLTSHTLDGGVVKTMIGNDNRSAAQAVIEYVKLVDMNA